MARKDPGPAAIFGIRIKTLVIVLVFLAALLLAMNRSEIVSLFNADTFIRQQEPTPGSAPREIVVDEKMLSAAMQEVQAQKLAEMEAGDGSIPTDRFFFIVELVSGGDLEGVELTIEPDHVILVSEGGTSTTIKRTDVQEIHRHKLPPRPQE